MMVFNMFIFFIFSHIGYASTESQTNIIQGNLNPNEIIDKMQPRQNLCDKAQQNSLDFCKDPYTTICSFAQFRRDEKRQIIKNAYEKIEQEALKKINQKYNKSFQSRRDINERSIEDEWRHQVRSLYTSKLTEKVGTEEELYHSSGIIKNYLIEAIDTQRIKKSSKKRLKKFIQATEAFYSHQIQYKSNDSRTHSKTANLLHRNRCSVENPTGMSYTDNKNAIYGALVCSESILTYLEKHQDPSNTIHGSFFIMAHEIAHNMDSIVFPKMYNKYLKCLQRNYAEELGPVEIHKRSKNGVLEVIRTSKNIAFYQARELISDYWAAQALGEYIHDQSFSYEKKLQILAQNYGDRCDDNGNTVTHPGGRFRIGALLQSQKIREAMNCAKPEKKVCTLK